MRHLFKEEMTLEDYKCAMKKLKNNHLFMVLGALLGVLALIGVVALLLNKCNKGCGCGDGCHCDDDLYDEEEEEEDYTDEHGCPVVKESDLVK